MNTKKQGRLSNYDSAFKVAVAREYLTGNLGYGALAKKYGLPHPTTVVYFVKWYKKNYTEDVQQPDEAQDAVPDNVNSNQALNN